MPQKITPFLQNRWPTLLSLILAVLLCWQLAHWTWVFFAPVPPRPATAAAEIPDPVRLQAAIQSANLFGTASSAPSPSAQASTSLNLHLSGVFASEGQLPAVAIIKVENQGDLPFRTGDTLLPGVTLEQVKPDHVVLKRSGVRETLRLEQNIAPLTLQGTTASPLRVRREGPGRFGIARSELKQALSDPAQLATAGRVTAVVGQGVRIEEAGPGSLMSRLGLQSGDLIRQINGRTVEKTADLLAEYQTSNTIRVKGTRNGQPFEYNYIVH